MEPESLESRCLIPKSLLLCGTASVSAPITQCCHHLFTCLPPIPSKAQGGLILTTVSLGVQHRTWHSVSTSVCGTGMSVLSPHSKSPAWVQEDLDREGLTAPTPMLHSFPLNPLGFAYTVHYFCLEAPAELPYTLRPSPAGVFSMWTWGATFSLACSSLFKSLLCF